MADRRPSAASAALAVRVLFVAGLAITALMLARGQVGGDQLNLLARGWLFAAEGRFIPHGNPMSTGGNAPGGITSLLVGLPLFLWRDHRAPTLVIFACHVLAYWLLDRTLRGILSPAERVFFAVLYWINPWRAYFAGFLWNPNYLFLAGALHLWTALAQRERARFAPSFLHGAMLVLAFQIHASFLLLFVASCLLWWRGYFKVRWAGMVLGGALAAVPLVPWVLDLSRHPEIADAERGFLGRGLLLVFPLLRGLVYWLRYSCLALGNRMTAFDFTAALGAGVDAWLAPVFVAAGRGAGFLTLVFPALANLRFWRGKVRRRLRPLPADAPDRAWVEGYAAWSLAALAIVFALSPTTPQMWQGLIVLHTAVLPTVLWLGALARSRHAPRVRRGVALYAGLELLLLLVMAFGSPHYRCGGRETLALALRHDHPMLHELGILDACPLPVDQEPEGWWPDVLPPG